MTPDDPLASARGPDPGRSDSLPFGARQMPPESGSGGPSQFGPFRLQRELGRGANGVVYLARRVDDPAPLALKVLLDTEDDSEGLARFQLEAQVASKLWHPGIVAVLGAGRVGRHRYCVMEFCTGETLRSRLRGGPLEHHTAATLVAKLARAVDYAHGEGVLHRDIKPANVLLQAPDEEPRLTDFGLARDRSLRRSLTRTGDVLGTPAFMAPEQILGDKDVDERVDVYALGVVLYQCLTGALPYQASTIPELVQEVLRGGATPAVERNPAVPRELSAVCQRAMAANREARYSSARTLAEALEAFGGPSESPPRQLGWLALLVALGVASLSATGAYALWVGRTSPPAGSPAPDEPSARDEGDSAAPPDVSEAPAETAPRLVPMTELRELGERLANDFRVVKVPGVPRGWQILGQRLDELLEDCPDDPRLPVYRLHLEILHGRATTLELCRALRALDPAGPALPGVFVGIVTRQVGALGFQRMARDLQEQAAAGGLDHAWTGLSLMHLRALTQAPVRDVEAACDAALTTIRTLEQGGHLRDPGYHPPGWDVYANLSLYRQYLGDSEGALAAMREAKAVAGDSEAGTQMRWILGQLSAGGIPQEVALGLLRGLMAHDDLGRAIHPFDPVSDGRPDLEVQRLEAQLQAYAQDPVALALLEVALARACTRSEQPQRALEVLEAAHARLTQADADVRALVARRLARQLLDMEYEFARAAELAREALAYPRLTRGERADAWLQLARAEQALGRSPDAALRAARALEPFDARELDAFVR